MKKKTIKWVMFTKRTEYPKLGYIIKKCRELKIPTRIQRASFHAPILEVPDKCLGKADRILSAKVDKNGNSNNRGHFRFDDVADDHPAFSGCASIKPDFE